MANGFGVIPEVSRIFGVAKGLGQTERNKRNPQFFGPELDEVEARLRQREQSLYGGYTADLREQLANAGLLASGALPDALSRAQIGLGQSTLAGISGLYGQELGQKRQFDINRALQLLQQDFERQQQEDAQNQNFLETLFSTAATVGGAFIPGLGLLSGSSPGSGATPSSPRYRGVK